MLSGRYPSDDFADLRPRLTWDRLKNTLTAREGAKRVAVINGGTIPDRGLYGVFLVGERGPGARVGELDEEMVFESRVGETFLLGASTWRIEEITHDRVLVSPAPGEPGKMPFWKADAAGRPLELGRQIGELVRTLRHLPPAGAIQRLVAHHDLDQQAAENLLRYLADQAAAAGVVPDDRTILIERCRDELGDWRICVLSPFGGRIHAPWAMAVVERARAETGLDVETMWTDDGFVVRFPETEEPPDPELMIPASEEVEALVVRQLGGTALFAAKFREAAARALLLPKRRPGGRSPLWQQRKRAADLLGVAAKFGSFPMLLEAYRECLRDVFDMPALVDTLRRLETREIKAVTVDSTMPVPIRVGAPLRLRRQLHLRRRRAARRTPRAGAGDRPGAAARAARRSGAARAARRRRARRSRAQLQHLEPEHHARSVDGVHDLLLRLGDLTPDEIAARSRIDAAHALDELLRDAPRHHRPHRRRAPRAAGRVRRPVSRCARRSAAGRASRIAAGARAAARTQDLARRYARTHGPFTTAEFAARYALGRATARCDPEGAGGVRAAARRRVPAGRRGPRVVRSGRAAVDPPSIAGAAPQAGRAGRPRGLRPAAHQLAGRRPPPPGARCAARRDREPPGRPAAGLDLRIRDPGGPGRGLQPGRPRRADAPPAKSSGAASSRSAIATAASRCTSTDHLAAAPPEPPRRRTCRRASGRSSAHLEA